MYEEIKNKFENFYNTKDNFIRINATHPIDIYLGITDFQQKSLVIIANGNINDIESSRFIKTEIRKREDNKIYLSFTLMNDSMNDLFYKFCQDIVESTADVSENEVISFIAKRWTDWTKLFMNPINSLLNENEIKGLFGELIFLNDYMFKKYGIDRGLTSWMGPDLSHKDFEIDDTWYEIKTTNQASLSIKINSIEQLDSDVDGTLAIIRLEPTNIENSKSITINNYINIINEKLSEKQKLLFERKLSYAKYKYEKEYNKYIYYIQKIDLYDVNNNFPKIKKEFLQNGILKVTYEISIESINKFKVAR